MSTQYRKFPCLCNVERSPYSAWVHFAANGARREADRERRTVRGHLLRGIFLPSNSGQFWAILGNSGQASSDWAAGVAVRAAVFGGATLAHSRRTERPFRPRICDQDAPSMRLGRSSSARSARASCAALFDSTNALRARQPGGAGQTAAGPAGEGLDSLAGLAGATKNKLRRRRMDVISPPRFFSPLFSPLFLREGQDARGARRAAAAAASAAETGSRSG